MPTETAAPIQVASLDHVTVIVSDIERSRRFYVEQLGMREVLRPAFSFDGAWFQAGATQIHLIREHDDSGPAGYPDGIVRKSSRNQHIAFLVDDARAAADRLKELGLRLISDAKLRPDGAVQVFVSDPDGHLVELCSMPKQRQPGHAQ